MADVVLENVSKKYDAKKIIDNVSLKIKDKEFLVLVGASGCGKSTLLRMIAGLETITEGKIFIDGKCVNDVHPKDRDIAMVFQNYALYPHMSVYDNIAFPLKMRGMKKDEIKEKVLEAAEILDLNDYLERKPKQLSGGQRQRVALGRAIVRKPKVFLMDEPLSNLDAKLRVQMRSEIKKLHERLQTTFIYVTHDQTEALTMGDNIAIIDKGVIQQIGSPDYVYNCPDNIFVGGFLGSPAMNFIPISISDNVVKLNDTEISLINGQKQLLTEKGHATLGIRPECIALDGVVKIPVKIDISEMLGSEKIIYFSIDGAKCSAKLPATVEIKDEMTIAFNPDDALLFDSETTAKIG